MVAQFLRLKLAVLANAFRGNPLRRAGAYFGLIYGLVLVVLAAGGLAALRDATPDVARVILIVFGSTVILGFLLLPLVFGVDDPLDPRRFALLGMPNNRLALGLAVAAFVSIPTVVVVIFVIAQVATWSRGPLPMFIAILSAVIIVPTCVLAARVSGAVASTYLASRRARDGSGIGLVLVLAVAAPLTAIIAGVDWDSQGLPIIRRIASVLGATPLGAAWGAPGEAALGNVDVAFQKLFIAIIFLGALVLAWRLLVGFIVVRPPQEARSRNYSGLGWFETLPATPAGIIAARTLTYWGRDGRYRVALAVIPIVPIVMVAALLIAGVPVAVVAWIPVPVMCLFLGWTVHNDLAHDSTAFWAHVSANTSGVDDRLGRIIPTLLLGIPLVIVGSLATAAITGQWASFPGLAGLSFAILMVGLGVSSVVSAAFPYPAVHPGDSPFAQPQAIGSGGSVVQSLSFLLTVVLTAPVIVLVVLGETVSAGWHWGALAAGVGLGLVAVVVGVRWGGHIVTKRLPELLAFTLQN